MTTSVAMHVEKTGTEIVFTRIIDAPRGLVFKAWTEPGHMARWWGPRPFTNPVCQMDVRPGGAYRIVMRSPEGVDYPLKGVYREVVEPERLVFTMVTAEHPAEWHALLRKLREGEPGQEVLTTVTFEEQDGKTRLTIRNRFASVADCEAFAKMGMAEGWSQSLDRLDELLATA